MPITIKVNNNASLMISAADVPSIQLTDAEGNVIPLPEGKNVFLCRCGLSARKPFCDGAHKTGFDGTCVAPAPAAG
jgi:CDGSH iron-sulfur domain-containing protein 3